MDLAGVVVVQEISWRGLDAAAVPQLRAPNRRFRRLPMSSLPAYRACRGNRSRMLARSRALDCGRGSARGERRFGSYAAGDRVLVRAIAEARCGFVELPHEPRVENCRLQIADFRLQI